MTARRQKLYDTLMIAVDTDTVNNLSDAFIFEVPCDIYHNCLDSKDLDIIVDKIFTYYRAHGFPYFDMSDDDIIKEYKKFMKFDMSKLVIDNNELNQIMHGLNITNNFFPNMWDVKCKNMRTPMEVFNDDVLFKKAIRKRISMSDCSLRPFGVRKGLKIYSGTQSVSGFRPSIAKCIVEDLFKGAKSNSISVLDPCMGWGGRLFGCVTSDIVETYAGFEVSPDTVEGLRCLKDKLIDLKLVTDTDIDIIEMPFEESDLMLQTYDPFDLVLTSPPYFDIEKYSYNSDQSFIKFNTYEKWLDGFLRPMIELSHKHLKTNGYLALNVGYGSLYDDTYAIMKDVFGNIDREYKMRLSKMCGRGIDKKTVKFKYEPIIVSKKLC
jgi:tRNA1(Val) A37 N6-methylase TrmN6